MASRSKRNKLLLWLSGIYIAGIILAGVYVHDQNSSDLRVFFFDVGQGDATLIRTPSHQNILIDAGPDTEVLSKLGATLPFYDRQIDLVILTHCHADHEGGLAAVLERYDVGRVIWSGVGDKSPGCLAWQDVSIRKNISIRVVSAGMKYTFGNTAMEILYPLSPESIAGAKDLNLTSIVCRMVYQRASFLFTGDAPVEVENILLKDGKSALASDVLKVGHHGSRYSSSIGFLEAVHPKYSVISVGKGNSYGHPHLTTIKRLEKVGSQIMRTDYLMDVQISTDGNLIDIK